MTFIDLPISGDLSPTGQPVDQDPISVLEDAMRAVLALDVVKAIRWRQYTPYFNDGDACVFSVREPTFLLDGADEDDGDYGDGFVGRYGDAYRALFGYTKYEWNGEFPNRKRTDTWIPGTNSEDGVVVNTLTQMMESGRHDVELGRLFGDHAVVTATTEGFEIEYYEHD